jgi:dTDP-4-dehydrorhamnose reductase
VIWLVGNKGMLGTEVEAGLVAAGYPHIVTDLDLDITDASAVQSFVEKHRPAWIVNCAAYTAVDRAEEEENVAYQINAVGPANLATAARSIGARLVHVSTDYVFAGVDQSPYPEDAPPAPVGAYGRTKAAGESLIREICTEHFIIRTAWLYGVHGKNFVETMLRLMATKPEISVVNDQRGSPTYAVDLGRALLRFIDRDSTQFGTYHFTNEGDCTWHEFAGAIQNEAVGRGILTHPVQVKPIPAAEYPTPAKRPAYSVLGKERIKDELGLTIPSWEAGLSRYFDQRLKERK